MCGIAALFTKDSSPEMAKWIREMTKIIHYRGPDDEGHVLFTSAQVFEDPEYFDGPCKAALGHRRLSILDLTSAGHQPMAVCDGQIWITYNGEIYNFLEIRQELESLGYGFRSNSDTEVILRAYEEWGIKALDKLNGMFAFVLYDRRNQKVLAVRDRFGVKPLYYWRSPQGFIAFASEIKQFTVLPGWNPRLNGQIAYDFLNWGVMDHTANTFFAGVQQIRGGEYAEFDLNELDSLRVSRWYTLREKHFVGTMQDACTQFYGLLADAIKIRLRADVDVGSCLSGGLDSSTIVCIANQFLREKNSADKQKTFSACSDVKRFDERNFIDHVVNTTGVDAYYTYPSLEHLFDTLEKIAWHQDEPFASTSIYAQWLVFKLVKENKVKVMLDGQGADEQLAGYHGFFGNRFFDLFQTLRWKTLYDEMRSTKQLHQSVNPLGLLVNKLVPNRVRQPLRKFLGKSAAKPEWLDCTLLNAKDEDPFAFGKNRTTLHQSLQQISHSSLPMLLHYEDRDSMAHSVESRTPFLDYRLVEFTLSLPSDYKIEQGWTKRVLRESMKGILPEEIRTRRDKLGFVTAEEEWMKSECFQRAIGEAVELSQGTLRSSSQKIMQEMISGKRPFNYLPWRMISFGHWIKCFSVKV